jgi:hypothetical protein
VTLSEYSNKCTLNQLHVTTCTEYDIPEVVATFLPLGETYILGLAQSQYNSHDIEIFATQVQNNTTESGYVRVDLAEFS